MLDEIIFDNLQLISKSLDLIDERFSKISQPEDFVSSDYGILVPQLSG